MSIHHHVIDTESAIAMPPHAIATAHNMRGEGYTPLPSVILIPVVVLPAQQRSCLSHLRNPSMLCRRLDGGEQSSSLSTEQGSHTLALALLVYARQRLLSLCRHAGHGFICKPVLALAL